ncbi:GD22200 [Drosophila simulans]|uniref:GD22200 n=1 Tax=Drosophila simulans TaxID=7240 RepID=B4QA98_DROSI|nr:GD22200 [Drosophila simulans]
MNLNLGHHQMQTKALGKVEAGNGDGNGDGDGDGNAPTDILQQKPAKATTAIVGGRSAAQPATHDDQEAATTASTATKRKHLERLASDLRQLGKKGRRSRSVSPCSRYPTVAETARMLSERSLLSGYGAIESSAKKLSEAATGGSGGVGAAGQAATPTTSQLSAPASSASSSSMSFSSAGSTCTTNANTASVAAAYAAFYLEKVKHEKMDNHKDAPMVTIHNNNNNNTINNNNSSSSSSSIINNHQSSQPSLGHSVKRERLSPGSNSSSHNGELTVSSFAR